MPFFPVAPAGAGPGSGWLGLDHMLSREPVTVARGAPSSHWPGLCHIHTHEDPGRGRPCLKTQGIWGECVCPEESEGAVTRKGEKEHWEGRNSRCLLPFTTAFWTGFLRGAQARGAPARSPGAGPVPRALFQAKAPRPELTPRPGGSLFPGSPVAGTPTPSRKERFLPSVRPGHRIAA